MGNKNSSIAPFEGAAEVKPASTLCKEKLTKLCHHLGFGNHTQLEEFQTSRFNVLDVSEKDGVLVKGYKKGVSADIWVSPRFLEPVSAAA